MQAVILAAGKGTRLFPLAVSKPKPLVRIANKSILEHNLDQMIGLVDEAILIVGYKREMIIKQFGNTYNGIKLTYVVQEEQKGTGHAVLLAKPYVKGKFLVVNGDDLFSRQDFSNIARHDYSILVEHKEDTSAFGSVVIENGVVKDLVEKSKIVISHYVNAGLYCLQPDVFPILESVPLSPRGEYELTDAIKIIAQREAMHAETVRGYWIPVGYPWHILDATKQLLEQNFVLSFKRVIGEGTVVEEKTILEGNLVIGKNCYLGKGCVIKGFAAIGANTIIKENTILQNVVIGQNCTIESDCNISDSVLGDDVHVSAGVQFANKGNSGSIQVRSNGNVYDSGKEQLGAFVGDACNVSHNLMPGECVGK